MKMTFILLISVLHISIYSQQDIDTILTEEELMNAEYGSAKLENGHYNLVFNAIAALDLYYIMHAYCELNGDSLVDAVVVLLESQGSGKYPNVIPVINNYGKPKPLESLMLGNRYNVKNIYKKDEFIFIEYIFDNKLWTIKLRFAKDEFIIVE